MDHGSKGTRWDFPPRRRSFFGVLDSETVKFVHGVLRRVQGQDEKILELASDGDGDESAKDSENNSSDAGSDNRATQDDFDAAEIPREEPRPSPPKERPSVNMEFVREFSGRTAANRRKKSLTLALWGWSSIAMRLHETRTKVNLRFYERQKVRGLGRQRIFLVALKKNVSDRKRAREVARNMLENKRTGAAEAVLIALKKNLERSRFIDKSANTLKLKIDASWALRTKSRVVTALFRACDDAIFLYRRVEEMRAEGLTRLIIEAFGGWAAATGFAGRLRGRLDHTEKALLENIFSAWALFSKHSVENRMRRKEPVKLKATRKRIRAWDVEVLDISFIDWVNFTAASKFRRLRLLARTLHGWRMAARTSAAGGAEFKRSREKQAVLIAAAKREADKRFNHARRKRLAGFFENWAREVGLASRLRQRLGKVNFALVHNAFWKWKIFAKYSMRKREEMSDARASQRKENATLQGILWAWAKVAAASKFYRRCLCYQTFFAWRAAV